MLGRGRRMRRRGLVAGAAIAHSQDARYEQQQQQQAGYDQQAAYQEGVAAGQAAAPPAPAAPAEDPMDHKIAELEKLSKLRDSGVLTEEEFAAQKQQILNS